ncbi:MAG: glycosyltransferase [Cyanobacteria bacterium P01_F01_bin.53]
MLSTPVAPLGSGLGGGVELTITNLSQVLVNRGHRVSIAAPQGSCLPATISASVELIQVPGNCQPIAQNQARSVPILVCDALANAWAIAQQQQQNYDLLVNFAYDWLPFYLTPFFRTPVAHFVTMGSLNDALDSAIAQLDQRCPGVLGAYTRSQANTFAPSKAMAPPIRWEILGSAVDISRYEYCPESTAELAWVGRISPEKGLEDAIAVAIQSKRALNIFGKLENPGYWEQIQLQIEQAASCGITIRYCGFLPTAQLQKALGQCQALLVTPRWLEAFGMVVIEALACGVPVIAYRSGGPAEIILSGETGYLVKPGDVDALVRASAQVAQIDRARCRELAEAMYSLEAWGIRFEKWFYQIVSGKVPGSE